MKPVMILIVPLGLRAITRTGAIPKGRDTRECFLQIIFSVVSCRVDLIAFGVVMS